MCILSCFFVQVLNQYCKLFQRLPEGFTKAHKDLLTSINSFSKLHSTQDTPAKRDFVGIFQIAADRNSSSDGANFYG